MPGPFLPNPWGWWAEPSGVVSRSLWGTDEHLKGCDADALGVPMTTSGGATPMLLGYR